MLTPVCVYHPMARMCGYVCRPYDVKNPYLAPLTVNRELHKGGDRSCMHIELDISESKIRWGFISASVLEWENMTGTGLLILSVLSRSSCLIKKIKIKKKLWRGFVFVFLPDVTFFELQTLPTKVTVLLLPFVASFMSKRAGHFQWKDSMPGARGEFCAEL